MIRVLEVFGEPISYGGQESFFFNVLQHIDVDNLNIDIFTPYYCDNDISRKMVEDYGGKLTTIGLPFEPGKSRTNIYKPLISHLRKNQYDVVHIHSGSTSVLALAARAAGRCGVKKIIAHSHCTGTNKNLTYRLTKSIMAPILNYYPTDYCACSKEAGEWKFPPQAMKKLIILKNGIDLDKFRYSSETRERIRNELGIRSDDYVIGHVGRFSYQKNQEFIVDLLKAIKPSIPKTKVIFVGSGETLEQIKKQAEEYSLRDDIYFIGNVNNVQDYLQAMDVFAFPSRFEGLGIAGIEAQAVGLPVIASTNVPEELGRTSLVQFIDLRKKDLWITSLAEARESERQDVRENLRYSGYDIRNTSDQIHEIYLSKHE